MWGNAALRGRVHLLEVRLAELSTRCAQLTTALERSTTTRLSAELDDLKGAVDVANRGMRRELGRMWKRLDGVPDPDAKPETAEQIRARLGARHPGVAAQLADPATHTR